MMLSAGFGLWDVNVLIDTLSGSAVQLFTHLANKRKIPSSILGKEQIPLGLCQEEHVEENST